jgi:hypothetical protein
MPLDLAQGAVEPPLAFGKKTTLAVSHRRLL